MCGLGGVEWQMRSPEAPMRMARFQEMCQGRSALMKESENAVYPTPGVLTPSALWQILSPGAVLFWMCQGSACRRASVNAGCLSSYHLSLRSGPFTFYLTARSLSSDVICRGKAQNLMRRELQVIPGCARGTTVLWLLTLLPIWGMLSFWSHIDMRG